jgi:hypothetical protein
MWLREFHGLFGEATERFTDRRLDVAAIEGDALRE